MVVALLLGQGMVYMLMMRLLLYCCPPPMTHMGCRIYQAFHPSHVPQDSNLTVFMGVPTMYSLLLSHYDSMPPEQQASARRAAAALRLTISGSSACPVPIMERWKELTGSYLLERYDRVRGQGK